MTSSYTQTEQEKEVNLPCTPRMEHVPKGCPMYAHTFIFMNFTQVPAEIQQKFMEAVIKVDVINMQVCYVGMKFLQIYKRFKTSPDFCAFMEYYIKTYPDIYYDVFIQADNFVKSGCGFFKDIEHPHLTNYLANPYSLAEYSGVDYFMKKNAKGELEMRVDSTTFYVEKVVPVLMVRYGEDFKPRVNSPNTKSKRLRNAGHQNGPTGQQNELAGQQNESTGQQNE